MSRFIFCKLQDQAGFHYFSRGKAGNIVEKIKVTYQGHPSVSPGEATVTIEVTAGGYVDSPVISIQMTRLEYARLVTEALYNLKSFSDRCL